MPCVFENNHKGGGKTMLKLLKREKGFTLIELMVVVLIIAILVAIAVPVFNVARTAAQRRTCQANLRTIDGAIQTYNADNDHWPTAGIGDLVPDYMKSVPECPTNNGVVYVLAGADPPTVVCPNGIANHIYP